MAMAMMADSRLNYFDSSQDEPCMSVSCSISANTIWNISTNTMKNRMR